MQNNKHLNSLLSKLGITESGVQMYLLLQKMPGATVRDLQLKLGFSKAKTYRIFEELLDNGFVYTDQKDWNQRIYAISFATLADKLLKEQRKIGKMALELKKMSGLLSFAVNSEVENSVTVLTDYAEMAMHKIDLISKKWDLIKCYGAVDRLIDVIGYDVENSFVKKRVKSGKLGYAIFTEMGDYARDLLPKGHLELRKVKLALDQSKTDCMVYSYEGGATIWANDEALGKRAIVINDPVLAKIYEQNFDTAWGRA